jgi:hypothetical protein
MTNPRDDKGHFVPRACPNPDCSGILQAEHEPGTGLVWRCDGLIDPNDPNKELEACEFSHIDGQPYNEPPLKLAA